MQYQKKLIISGDLFFFKRSSLGTSDIQGCYSPKGITYMIFTLIHGRDPIPWRITYIEFRSPVKIVINFLRNTTQFHLFSLQNMFFFIVHPSIAPAKRVATHFPCWNRSCPFAELVWITGGCSNPCFCQKPEKIYFPGSKWIAGNILCICCFFPIPEDVFILCIGFFTDSGRCFWGRNYRFCILCIPSGLYIYYIYTRVFAHICTTWRGKHSNCWNAGKNNFKGNRSICGNAGRKQFQGGSIPTAEMFV